jgi:hypothetical protein
MSAAAIYARYSSDLQREASIEDQIRICRERAVKEGWPIYRLSRTSATGSRRRCRDIWPMSGDHDLIAPRYCLPHRIRSQPRDAVALGSRRGE